MEKMDSNPNKARNTLVIVFVGLVLAFVITAAATSARNSSDANTGDATSQGSEVNPETTPEAVEVDPNALSVEACTSIHTDITLVNNTMTNATFTPSQAAQLLSRASSDWSQASAGATGSESEWLAKMSELASGVSSYILTGSPSNGVQKLDQLTNNMNLYSQFCPSPSY